MKIGIKLTLMMALIGLFSAGIVATLLLLQSRSVVLDLSNRLVLQSSRESSDEVRSAVRNKVLALEAVARILEQYENIMVENRRNFIINSLTPLMEEYYEIIGSWAIFEPNILEGNDAYYIGSEGSSPDGRFVPYWFKEANGNLRLTSRQIISGDWYNLPRQMRNIVLLNPYVLLMPDGSNQHIFTIATPLISGSGQVFGVIGVDVPLERVQELADMFRPSPEALVAIFSSDGTVGAHFDPTRIGRNMRETERDIAGQYFDGLLNAVRLGESFSYSFYNTTIRDTMDVKVVPIRIEEHLTNWSYMAAFPRKSVTRYVDNMLYTALGVTAFVLIMTIIAAFIMSRSLSKPIIEVAKVLKDISEGEGDLTKKIPERGNDEIADMSRYFNMTIDKIRNLIVIIKQQSSELLQIGEDLSFNMGESSTAINEISSAIQSIKNRAVSQGESVGRTNDNMEHITSNITRLNEQVDRQSASVSQSSTAIEEMLANINAITQTLVKNVKNVSELSKASDVGRTGLQDVSKDIREIAKESEGLLAINAVIENIASQTNLLSMNAAIESAHAGESGKGFAVVAGEIRKLAASSTEQSKTIAAVLKKIKESIDKIIVSTDNVLKRFEAIDTGVKIVSEQEEHIRTTMEEQGAGSKQILESISELNNISREVEAGAEEMLEGSKKVIKEADSLEKETQEIVGGISEMSISTEHVNKAIAKVNEITWKNKDGINRLVTEISHFKVS